MLLSSLPSPAVVDVLAVSDNLPEVVVVDLLGVHVPISHVDQLPHPGTGKLIKLSECQLDRNCKQKKIISLPPIFIISWLVDSGDGPIFSKHPLKWVEMIDLWTDFTQGIQKDFPKRGGYGN